MVDHLTVDLQYLPLPLSKKAVSRNEGAIKACWFSIEHESFRRDLGVLKCETPPYITHNINAYTYTLYILLICHIIYTDVHYTSYIYHILPYKCSMYTAYISGYKDPIHHLLWDQHPKGRFFRTTKNMGRWSWGCLIKKSHTWMFKDVKSQCLMFSIYPFFSKHVYVYLCGGY